MNPGETPGGQNPPGDRIPGFWVKVAAASVDLLVMMVPLPFVGIVAAVAIPMIAKTAPKDVAGLFGGILVFALVLGLPFLYFTLFNSRGGRTLGKMGFNLRVTRLDGEPVSFLRAAFRWVCSLLSLALLGSGFIVAAFRSDRRTLHDILAGTRVVSTGPYFKPALVIVLVVIPFGGAFMGGVLAAIAIPKFVQMVDVAKIAALKAKTADMRSAVTAYYADSAGTWPKDLSKDLVPKYIEKIPVLKFPKHLHQDSDAVETYPFTKPDFTVDPALLKDTGHWLYDPTSGKVVVDCTHVETRSQKPFYTLGQP